MALAVPPERPKTWGEMWRAVGDALVDAARREFPGEAFTIGRKSRGERHNGGNLGGIRVIVAEEGVGRFFGFSRRSALLEFSLHVTDSPRNPMQVGALHCRASSQDLKDPAERIAETFRALLKERELERLAPIGQPIEFSLVRRR